MYHRKREGKIEKEKKKKPEKNIGKIRGKTKKGEDEEGGGGRTKI